MKHINVKRLDCQQVRAIDIPNLFKEDSIPYQRIDTVDWEADYPYCPFVEFAIAHTGNAILLHYRVEEDCVRAENGSDLGNVWEDSCCEFFCKFDDNKGYYNLETNCIGTILLCHGKGREGRNPAPQPVLSNIDRWSSLGRNPFNMINSKQTWELSLVVPMESFFQHAIKDLSGSTIHANFYKCGDKTTQPHFLSWNPIVLSSPDFHRPDFFGELNFL